MLSPKVIFFCTDELLGVGSNEALETLCAFLDTLGAAFDTPEWPGRPRLEEVFGRAQSFAEDPRCSARIRCLLKDLLDKRRNGWRQWPTRASESGRNASNRAEGSDVDPAGSPQRPALSTSSIQLLRGCLSDSSQGGTTASDSACHREASRIQQRPQLLLRNNRPIGTGAVSGNSCRSRVSMGNSPTRHNCIGQRLEEPML